MNSPKGLDRIAGARIAALLLFLSACSWVAVLHLTVPVVAEDDAFITFRYSDNLAAGDGLVFNSGERVFGSSTPLFVLWLAGVKTVFPDRDIPTLAVRTNLLWLLGTAFALALILTRMTGRPTLAQVVTAWFLFHPAIVTLSWKGMEAFLLTFLILAGIAAAQRDRFILMAALFGLAAVTRPEGVLAVVVGATVLRNHRTERPMIFWAALLLPGVLWTVFATAYFGTPIPHSLIAKAAPLYPLEPGAALTTIGTWFVQWIMVFRFHQVSWWVLWTVLAVSVAGGLGLLFQRETSTTGSKQVGYLLLTIVALYGVTNPMLFHWYGANLFVFWLPAVVVGLPAFLSYPLGAAGQERLRFERHLQTAIACGLALTMLWSYGSATVSGRSVVRNLTAFNTRVLGYQKTGYWLKENAPPSSVVCAPEIGALGYYWEGPILDACALVSPDALPFLPCPPNQRLNEETAAIPILLAKSKRPEYIVSLAHFIRQGLLTSKWFSDTYELVHRIKLDSPLWQSDSVLIFRKKTFGEVSETASLNP